MMIGAGGADRGVAYGDNRRLNAVQVETGKRNSGNGHDVLIKGVSGSSRAAGYNQRDLWHCASECRP
jgi:hypothetical protein